MRGYLVVTGLLFGAVALAHLLRLIYASPVQIAAEVAGGLCIWGFALARGVRGA